MSSGGKAEFPTVEIGRTFLKDDQQRDPVLGTDIVSIEDKDSSSVWKTEVDLLIRGSIAAVWMGVWDAQADLYYKNQMVRDGEWLMIANKNTVERAGPQATGDPFHIYNGTITPLNVSAKILMSGIRLTVNSSGYLTGYRTYVESGNQYEVYLVTDVFAANPITELIETFTATTNGWRNSSVSSVLVEAGITFDLLLISTEPNPSPTTFSGDWNYTTPQNPGVPGAGVILHPTKDLQSFNVNYIDDALADRTAELQSLSPGDYIQGANQSWTIQSSVDNGNYIEFIVSPAQQGFPTGIENFVFNTTVATPIEYAKDTDYWLTENLPNVKGLFIADGAYADIVPDNSAYGVDLYVQYAIISEDWDFMSHSDSAGGNEDAVPVAVAALSETQNYLSRDEFLARFLPAELEAIVMTASNTLVPPGPPPDWEFVYAMMRFIRRTELSSIDLTMQLLIDLVNLMESEGIISPGRAAIILSTT